MDAILLVSLLKQHVSLIIIAEPTFTIIAGCYVCCIVVSPKDWKQVGSIFMGEY